MTPTDITVIGLGAMGRAVAAAFLAAGRRTTVWNRTPSRAGDLVAAGARHAATVADALEASPVAVVCVLDPAAVEQLLDRAGDRIGTATIINVTSSTPEHARAFAARVTAAGGRYLDGKIMVPTTVVGTEDALVLYSGDPTVFTEHVDTLRALGGKADHLGDDPGAAAIYDLAMLDIYFTGMAAFLHASALVGADGVSSTSFLPYAQLLLDVLRATFPGLAAEVDAGEHAGDEDNLEMEQAFLDHIVTASAGRGVNTSVPATPKALVDAAIRAGHGRDSFSRVIDVLRQDAA
jgi:3-hydroxyisobutyrate dehydrogenase-like beta-hydroxyacid dehydrogenase